jgi:rhodanese-related sulfurtransferase
METTAKPINVGWLLLLAVLAVLWAVMSGSGTRYSVREVSAAEAQQLISNQQLLILDVRESEPFTTGHIPGARGVPIGELQKQIESLPAAKTDTIVVYCGDGSTRGPRATAMLNEHGYVHAVNVKGGYQGWQKAGYPVSGK